MNTRLIYHYYNSSFKELKPEAILVDIFNKS